MTTEEALHQAALWAQRAAAQVPETTSELYGAACAQVSLAHSQLAIAFVAQWAAERKANRDEYLADADTSS